MSNTYLPYMEPWISSLDDQKHNKESDRESERERGKRAVVCELTVMRMLEANMIHLLEIESC